MASAKQIRDEIMKMTIIVNSNPAQQEIYKLTEANRKLADESTKLRAEREKVRLTLGKESQEYKELTQKINDNSLSISNNKRKMQELTDSLDISQMSVKQLKQELTLLKRELDRTVPDSTQYNALQERIGQVQTRLGEVRNGARSTQLSFQSLADKFNQYSGIVTAVAAVLIGFGLSVQNIIDRNNKMADAMSQVEKNANMTRQEVEALTRSFSDMDTRTKKIDLLNIANEGGKLGVAKEDIKSFVEETDKANVALGDSWEGGAAAIANSLGKISGLYEETKNQPIAKSINEIGSGLNDLAASGAASEQNVADFARRIGGLPNELKPTIQEALALGAAFEESGIDAERSATAYTTFISTAAKEVDKFAYVMKLPVAQVKEMINTNPTEFFLKFSEGLKGMDAVSLAKTLDFLKLNDQYVKSIVGAASDNTERFRDTIELSKQAVGQATSLTAEFDKMNNNAAGIFEKIQKKIAETFTSQTFANFINTSVQLLGKFLGVVKDADGSVTLFRSSLLFLIKVIAILTVSTISYNLLLGVYNTLLTTAKERVLGLSIIEKSRNALTATSNILQAAWNVVSGAGMWIAAQFTRNLNLQVAAQERLNLVTKANPWGAILGLVMAVATAYLLFRDNTEKAKNSQQQLNEVLKEGAKNAGAEVNALEQTYKKLTNKNIAEKDRQKLLDEANKQYPGFFKNLTIEDFLLGKAAGQYNKLRTAIIAASQARAADAKINEIAGKYLEKEVELTETIKKAQKDLKGNFTDQTRTYVGQSGGGTYTVTANEQRGGVLAILNRAKKELAELQRQKIAELNPLIDIVDKNPFKNIEPVIPDFKSNYVIPGDTGKESDKANQKAENAQKRLLEDYKRRADEAGKLSVELEKEIKEKEIEAMEDGFAKELALIDEQERQKLAELEKKKITPEEIKKLQEIEAKATGADKEFFSSLLKQWKANNQEIENAKNAEIKFFADKRKALGIKYKNEELADANKAYDEKLALLERQKNDEINSFNTLEDLKKSLVGRASASEISQIDSWQKGKEALTKVYQKKELELHVAHLEAMVKLYEGLDLTILDEKEREKVMKFITEAQNKIASLKAGAKGAGEVEDKTPKKLSSKGSTDILGLSKDDWEALFNNLKTGDDLLNTISASVEVLKNAFNSYYSLVQAKEQAQVRQVEVAAKRREKALKKQLDSGFISQEEYETGVQKLNEDTEKKKAQLEYEAAKRQRTIQIITTIANTAQAVMNMMATAPWPVNLVMAGIATAMGAMQIATIQSTPLPEAPGYEQGFGTEQDVIREQDGKRFRAVRRKLTSGPVTRPTHFIAGENGVEMVIDSPTYTKFPESVKRTINQQIAIAKGYEGGRYPYLSEKNNSSSNDLVLLDALERNTQAMNSFVNKNWTATVDKNDMRSAKNMIEMQEDFNYYKNK